MEEGALDSLAPGTARAYQRAYQEFLNFLRGGGDTPGRRVSPRAVREYLLIKKEKGLAASTLKAHAAAISFFEQVKERPDPCKSYLTRRMLAGWARKGSRPPDARLPISLDILKDLMARLPRLCYSSYETALFRAAFGLTFYGAFRCSEVVANSRHGTGGFRVQDLKLTDRAVGLHLRKSKTDQQAKGAWVWLQAGPAPSTCPVALTRAYLGRRGLAPGQLFRHADGSALSRYQFASILRKGLGALGLRPGDYGTHSFRIGAASVAAAAGMTDDQVKQVGRWRSRAFRAYVRDQV